MASCSVSCNVTDFVLKSAAQSLYSKGPFQQRVKKINWIVNGVLKLLGLPQGPVEVELSEVLTVTIGQSGVSVEVNARAQSLAKPDKPALPVACQVDMKVDIKENRLILLSNSAKCKVKPETSKGKVVRPVVNLVLETKFEDYIDSWFGGGVPIPLPEGVDFTQSKVDYHDGFVVVSGNLNLTPAAVQNVLNQLMAKVVNM